MRKILFGIGVAMLLLAGCGTSAGEDLSVEVSLDGQPLSEASRSNPITLDRGNTAELQVVVENSGSGAVTVEHILLEGEVIDMTFLSYDTAIQEVIEPGQSRTLTVPVDFFDLGGQANGLLAGQVNVFDAERNSLGAQQATFDVRGGAWSTLTLFNLLLAVGFVGSAIWNFTRMTTRQLPANRFLRGVRFAYSGIAAGLAISVAFSLLRLWPLNTAAWITITAITGVIGFVAGYLAPGPVDDDEDDILDLLDINEDAAAEIGA